jgi:glucokinase
MIAVFQQIVNRIYAILLNMGYTIAVDVGGTQVRAALYPAGSITPVKIERTNTRHPTSTPLEQIFKAIDHIWPDEGSVSAIGVAAPGPLDPFAGVIREAPNIPGWIDIPLRQELEEHFQVPVSLGNDANLAALGEWQFGAGQGHHHLIYITVSTGIGGGVISDDRLLLGVNGLAAELGHVTILPDGPMCGCGQPGHLEALSSGPAIARWAEEQLCKGIHTRLPCNQPLTAKMVGEAALAGDELAISSVQRAGYYLGLALANYLHIFNPTLLIIGGGVSQLGPLLMDPIWGAIKKFTLSRYYLDHLTLTRASLGDEAGLIGALAQARSLS